VVNVVGKRSRPVPVLLTADMMQAMDGLQDTRSRCGVPQHNPFVFALPGAKGHLNFFNVLRRVSVKAQLKKPHLLTTTRMRKHLATMAQVTELWQNPLPYHMGQAHYHLMLSSLAGQCMTVKPYFKM